RSPFSAYRPANSPTRTSISKASGGQRPPNSANGCARPPRRRNDLPCWKKRCSGACASHRRGTVPYRLRSTHFEQADAAVKVRDLARRVGLSQRRFIQLFTTDVGLTPKLYGRVRRFQRARELVREATEPDWAAVALQCGFF